MKRKSYIDSINEEFKVNPIVALLGPRQCGKTTLADQYIKTIKGTVHKFDLEDPEDLAALENPKLLFDELNGTIVLDEIQRKPELFPYLRTLVDKEKRKRKILILGSASKDLIQQSSESLAGRISYIEITPFSLKEVNKKDQSQLWHQGGFPLSFLASTEKESYKWRKAYISTFLERDIPNLGIRIPSTTLRRFWQMIAHYQGQIVNYSELGRSFGANDKTIRNYLDILSETFMIRQLQPWHENIKKRQVKRPKIYLRDQGIFHNLLTIENKKSLLTHPKLGASWEGFALEQVLQYFNIESEEAFFWAVHEQGELDLFFQKNGKRIGVEFKFTNSPKLTSSMEYAINHLNLDLLICIHSGDKKFKLSEKVITCGLNKLGEITL
jgi:predicted AAA+ superfamily ATPase